MSQIFTPWPNDLNLVRQYEEILVSNIGLLRAGSRFKVRFDLAWEGSWRGDGPWLGNWDAAWVFVKMSASNRPAGFPTYVPGTWGPAHFSTNPAEHSDPPNGVVVPSEDGLGAFVHRSEPGSGSILFPDVELTLAEDTSEFVRGAEDIGVTVLAVRMVHVPAGDFWVGDPRGSRGPACCIYDGAREGEDNQAYPVTSEAAIEVSPEGFYYSSRGFGGDRKGPIPEAFPKGHQAFYVMRSHLSQGQYARFMNLLPGSARTVRYPYLGEGSYRFEVFVDRSSVRIATRPQRPCNFLAWADGTAWAAWAALRPMTELEFTKAARGPLPPVAGEYAWGSTEIVLAQVIIGPEDTGNEVISGNCNTGNAMVPFDGGDGGQGPVLDDAMRLVVQVGHRQFSASGQGFDNLQQFMREQSGASYYGVMGLSGNLWELCVTVGAPEGRIFTGKNGTGSIDSQGSPDYKALGWPDMDGVGMGFRGGSWYTDQLESRVADRSFGGGLPDYIFRAHDTGFRAVRTAPATDQ